MNLSYHNDNAIKTKFVARARGHQKADEIVKGQYWGDGKGCAVGCLVHSSSHLQLSSELGIPLGMARLIDRLFEGMPTENAKKFPLRFVQAIPVGKDLNAVMDRYYFTLLSDEKMGSIAFASHKVKPSIQTVIDLYARRIAKDNPSTEEWIKARRADAASYAAAAYAAAAYAAAADAADDDAAYAAAAAAAAAYAADAADAAADAARQNHFLWQAELLITLLKEAK